MGAKVDEHAITIRVLGEQCGDVKAVGKKVKGIRSSTSSIVDSQANFRPRFSSCPTPDEFAARAEAKQARAMAQAYGDYMRRFVATLQS